MLVRGNRNPSAWATKSVEFRLQVHVHQVFDGNGSSPTPSFGRRLSLFDEPASGCRTPQPSYDTNCALNLIT